MTDTFKQHSRGLTSPPEDAAEIVPDDAAVLAYVTRALYVGGGGDARVRMLGGAVVTLSNVPTGALIPIRVTQVLATGTSANGIVGFW